MRIELRTADRSNGVNPKTTQPFNRTHRYLFSVHVYWGLDRISKLFTLSIFCFQDLIWWALLFPLFDQKTWKIWLYFTFPFISELSFMLHLPSAVFVFSALFNPVLKEALDPFGWYSFASNGWNQNNRAWTSMNMFILLAFSLLQWTTILVHPKLELILDLINSTFKGGSVCVCVCTCAHKRYKKRETKANTFTETTVKRRIFTVRQ